VSSRWWGCSLISTRLFCRKSYKNCFTYFLEPISPLSLQIRVEDFSLVWMVSLMAVMLPYEIQLKQSMSWSRLFLTCLMAVEWEGSFYIISKPLYERRGTVIVRLVRKGRRCCWWIFRNRSSNRLMRGLRFICRLRGWRTPKERRYLLYLCITSSSVSIAHTLMIVVNINTNEIKPPS
jgi:hypothetical protein